MTETHLVKFSPSDTAISLLKEQYMGLKVNGIDDKEGLKAVHEARMVVKGKRVEVEKRRKELKAEPLEYLRNVDAEAKRITSLLKPIEDHLQHEEDIVTREKERIAAEEAARVAAITKTRMEKLADVGASPFPTEVQMWTDEDFEAELKTHTDAFNAKKAADEAERKARAEEAERNRIEAERLAEERRKMEESQAEQRRLDEIEAEKQRAEKAELDRQRAELEAEKQRLADERAAEDRRKTSEAAEKERFAQTERDKAEAAEKARIATEERLQREADERAERERIEAEKATRREARKPWRVKIAALADRFATVDIPAGKDCDAMRDQVVAAIAECVEKIRNIIRED